MSDVFVSYKAEDRRRVQPLVEALQADGLTVWWDEHIGTGDAWRETIERQLNEAQCVVVVWSKRSVGPEGRFVREEASRAQRRNAYVPVLIDAVDPPLGFGESQATPLRRWHSDRSDPHYRALLSAIRRNVGHDRSSEAHAGKQVRVDRRMMIGGGAVAAAAVAGVGGWALLRSAAAGASSDSIAVLPFANLSGDPAQAYFSDGIAEEIRGALARIGGLKVVGSTSSEAVRNDDAETAAKKLAVANILTGSVRQSPSTMRISAELIDGRTGLDKWSQDYDRSPGDAIKIQTDIAENVASAMSAALGRAARAVIRVGGTGNPAAQKLYLQAMSQLRADDSEASVRTSIGLLDSAITLDPKFANAYASKASALTDLNGYYTGSSGSFEPGYVKAAVVARQAIALAPRLAAGHMALAAILLNQLDIGGGAVEIGRGHALAGSNADDLLRYAFFLALLGRLGESIEIAKQAQASDPLNPNAYVDEARAQFSLGRYSESEAALRKGLSLAPNRQLDRALLGWTLTEMAKYDAALAEFAKLPKDYLFRLVGEAILYARQGNSTASDAALHRAQQVYGDSSNYQYAEIHAQRGEKDLAFAALDRAWTFRDPGLVLMKPDAWLNPIRSDPRFTALLQKMNFPSV